MQPHHSVVGLRAAPSAWPDRSYAIARVAVFDEHGLPLSGARVTGVFCGDLSGTRTAITDDDGRALLQCGPRRLPRAFSFRVTAVALDESVGVRAR